LVELVSLPRLRKDDKQPVYLFTRTRPPRDSARHIIREFLFGVISKNLPCAGFLASSVKCPLAKLLRQSRPNRKPSETLNPSFALLQVEWARAQIPVQELPAPDMKVQALFSRTFFRVEGLSRRGSVNAMSVGDKKKEQEELGGLP
jgi:hypothetical protein